ncbi:type II toxin-antitoxin system HicA family toxin [Thiohalocapsa sp. ML1]|jgi:predicted RNA binding protein YcfA (HicA-like mRNA interferase family)|uniref:type II toxin-antitoxin system HicA family toxin n=1 Tax=Thiohalocapsa sp. ML1 TaxID=1431688 RepID=UPI0009EAD374|nr:type II toxin-antitoxin system HicA family toxin [Thiohalocapsa sp. ML1]
MTGKDAVKKLKENGWVLDRIKGSHHIMKKEGFRPVPVRAGRDIPKSLISALERQTGVKLSQD